MRDAQLLRQAIGLATTAVPSMVMDPDDPVGMMQVVVDRVRELEGQVAALRMPPGYPYPTRCPHTDFLFYRMMVIAEMIDEGSTPAYVARWMSMDVDQVRLLDMTARECRAKAAQL